MAKKGGYRPVLRRMRLRVYVSQSHMGRIGRGETVPRGQVCKRGGYGKTAYFSCGRSPEFPRAIEGGFGKSRGCRSD